MLIGRHLLPTRHRARFIVVFIVVRLLLLATELLVFGGAPPTWLALLMTIALYAIFYFVGHRLGLYKPLPEENAAADPSIRG
jgi:hypothetical protein